MTRVEPTAEERRRYAAKNGVERTVADLVELDDPDAFEVRPPWPNAEDAWGKRKEPLPLPGIAAARRVLLAAMKVEREAIGYARGNGHTWTEICRALGDQFVELAEQAKRDHERPLAESAWRYAAHGVTPDQEIEWTWRSQEPTARWRCWTCGGSVYEGHAESGPGREKGHTPGCALLARHDKRGYQWT